MNFPNSLRAFVEQLFWLFFRFILALVWLVASEIKIKKSLHYLTSVIKFFVKSKKFKQNWTKPEALISAFVYLLLPKNNFWRRDWTAACLHPILIFLPFTNFARSKLFSCSATCLATYVQSLLY